MLTLPNGTKYKLCLLDTNALSEIAKYPDRERKGYIKLFPPDEFIPCFTPYTLFEIKRKPELVKSLVNLSKYCSAFQTKPFQMILNAEVTAKGRARVSDVLLQSFTPLGKDLSYNFKHFIGRMSSDPLLKQQERIWRTSDQQVLDEWVRNKENFVPEGDDANKKDAKRFVFDASVCTLSHLHPPFVKQAIDGNNTKILDFLPSLQMMLYSQYYRLFDPKRKHESNDVTDVCIAAVAPYVDAVITEGNQAEIYKKSQKHINGMSVQILRIKDIRNA